ncbi:MAG: hypothetical protein ACK40G_15210 [Cytophagaceae bacterium]
MLSICLLVMVYSGRAGGDPVSAGARNKSLAQASSALADEWSLYNNPAMSVHAKTGLVFGFDFENRYGISELNRATLVYLHPFNNSSLSAGFTRFGNALFNETRLLLGFSHLVDNYSFGARAEYYQLLIEEQQSVNKLLLTIGGSAKLGNHLLIGASLYNLNQAKMNKANREYMPTVLRLGIAYEPDKKIKLYGETEKDVRYKPMFKAGGEYFFTENFHIGTGFSSEPSRWYLGTGIQWKGFKWQYTGSYHLTLGFTHTMSISIVPDEIIHSNKNTVKKNGSL